MNKTNTLSEALETLSSLSVTPVAPVRRSNPVCDENPIEQDPAAEVKIDLNDVDWSEFTIGGVVVKDLLMKALNSMVADFENDPEGADEFTFTLGELYDRAGLTDVMDVYDQLIEGVDDYAAHVVMAEDEDGYNWRYYLTNEVLDEFGCNGWDVEVEEAERPDQQTIDELIRLTTLFGGVKITPEMKAAGQDEVLRHNTRIALIEQSLANDVVTMTIEDEDEDEDDGGASDENDVERPTNKPCEEEIEDKTEITLNDNGNVKKFDNLDDALRQMGKDLGLPEDVVSECIANAKNVVDRINGVKASARVAEPQRETRPVQQNEMSELLNILFGLRK